MSLEMSHLRSVRPTVSVFHSLRLLPWSPAWKQELGTESEALILSSGRTGNSCGHRFFKSE